MWVDVTWGAGGSTADKTLEICINALKYHGLDVMMHLTCTNMEKEALHRALTTCKENGICNILALRGDPPAGVNAGEWKAVEGGFAYAVDLRYLKECERGRVEGRRGGLRLRGGPRQVHQGRIWRLLLYRRRGLPRRPPRNGVQGCGPQVP